MTRCLWIGVVAVNVLAASPPPPRAQAPYRTHNDTLTPREYASLADWETRASYLRDHIRASAGLLPPPEKTPLRPHVFGERRHADYSVFKVYFESLPGFFVTGNLYRPVGNGPFPAILSPHGHWTYGRLENTDIVSGPARAINLARQGFVVFAYDMIGYNDSRQLTHEFGGKREDLWGLTLSGLQLWNSIRSVDFLESLPEVDPSRIGATGESGGGTQTFLLAAVDSRIKVAAPVNMISLHMQGGCLCENMPTLRLDTNNVELAALIAPRPLLMVAATGDWTKNTPRIEYPAMRRIYALFSAEDKVHSVQFDAPHNYNRDSREAVYAWMAHWLQQAPAAERVAERPFTPERLPDLLVFHGLPLPDGALTREQLTAQWIASARERAGRSTAPAIQSALLHALAVERTAARPSPPSGVVVLAAEDRTLEPALRRAGFHLRLVPITPDDPAAVEKIEHFTTYNRTTASQRVADVVRTLNDNPGAMLVADDAFGPAALLALAAAPAARAIVDVAGFDNRSDDAFVERLYIPGIRRAGDFQTAVAMARGPMVVHNAGGTFRLDGVRLEQKKLTPGEIAALLRGR